MSLEYAKTNVHNAKTSLDQQLNETEQMVGYGLLWNLVLTAYRAGRSAPRLIDSTMNKLEVLQMGIFN
jgi:hypothetical protein